MNNNVLVTGGAGYIGSHVCKTLSENGYNPITYDNLERGNEWAVKWGPLEIGDLKDNLRLNEVIVKYNPIAIIHLANYAYVGESTDDPMIYYENNLIGSVNLIKSSLENNIKSIIFSSSCAVYGIPSELPIKENQERRPINPYGMSKLVIEKILEDLIKVNKINYISLRFFNAAGASESSEIGEDHNPETHIIPILLESALYSKAFSIFGKDYNTPDGTCIRDYVHVDDLANAHFQSLKYLLKGGKSSNLNLGTGKGFSILELIEIVEAITSYKIDKKYLPRRNGDPPILIADSTKSQKLLNWNPVHSSIENIISSSWKWYRNKEKD